MSKKLGSFYKTVKDYSGTITNTTIVVITGGFEQLTTLAIYRCPCVEPSKLGPLCHNTSANSLTCAQTLNFSYGLSFLLAPAFALFIFTFSANPKLWKSVTGCVHKSKEHKRSPVDAAWTIFAIFSRALVSPFTWICIALVDGRYLACSLTPLPYDIGPKATFQNCEKVSAKSTPTVSDTFQNRRTLSQVYGTVGIVILLAIGFTVYCITKCTFPLTYYHAKYYTVYRQFEQNEFEEEMNAKAKVDADKNVKEFLRERREKEMWDRISTVFEFHRDHKQLALYSQLHEWVVEEERKEKEKNKLLEDGNKEKDGSDDDSSDEREKELIDMKEDEIPLSTANGFEMKELTQVQIV